ncbi:MAG: SpoIID/LytB domain protein [Modestobacter sp.]|nr:SpoIID/LytB domain protein [Modestobacter sp.]
MATERLRRLRRGLVVGLAGAAAVTVVQLPADPASAAAVVGSVQFTGHGYGHGRGLGQYGALGYAIAGASYQDIVGHYYGGATLSTQANGPVTVALTAQDGADLVVTSGRDFTVGGVPVSGGAAARVQAQPDGSFVLSTSLGCAAPVVWTTTIPDARVAPTVEPGADLQAMLSLCTANGTKQYRGELSVVWAGGAQHTVNTVRMEDYLRGVVPRESPASWGDAGGGRGIEALKAQTVAARSYAWSESRSSYAKTCDTTACQVYGGAGTNGVSIEDRRTDAAIAGTTEVVLRNSAGAIVRAEFSSSTGGYTSGGTFPAVLDEGDSASPYHDWSQSVSGTTVAAAFGVGELTDIRVTNRNGLGADGGRVTSVQIIGTAKTVTATGNDVRSKLGLKSDWFSVAALTQVVQAVQPVVYQASANGVGATALSVPFGQVGDVTLSCDWDGDGVSTLGIFRKGTFYVTNVPGAGRADSVFGFGQAGDQPVCGDWDGNGTDTVGVFRSGVVFLRNSNSTGVADGQFRFGQSGDRLVAGDWNADSFDTVGVWRNGTYYFTDSNIWPATSATVAFGDRTDAPVVGDWDGNGSDTIGVFRDGVFYLRNDALPGPAEQSVLFGDRGDKPLAGRWSANGGDLVGVARSY